MWAAMISMPPFSGGRVPARQAITVPSRRRTRVSPPFSGAPGPPGLCESLDLRESPDLRDPLDLREPPGSSLADTLFWHRWLGVSVLALAVVAVWLARRQRTRPGAPTAFRPVLFAAATGRPRGTTTAWRLALEPAGGEAQRWRLVLPDRGDIAPDSLASARGACARLEASAIGKQLAFETRPEAWILSFPGSWLLVDESA